MGQAIVAALSDPEPLRKVGRRKEAPLTFSASAALLSEGGRFNDEIHRLPTGQSIFVPRGVFRFKTHALANGHDLRCLVNAMANRRTGGS